jgi:spore photoproduct lyase-like protein
VKRVQALRVLVSRSAVDEPRHRARTERLLGRIEGGPVEVVSDEALERELVALGPREGRPRSGLAGRGQPKQLVAIGTLGDRDVFPGYSWREMRSGRQQLRRHGVLCQSAIEIQCAVGCPFDCAYCPYAGFLCVRVDVERFAERVAELARARRSQLLYKLNNRSDTLGLEPELGAAAALVERFAGLERRYLMLYSKGDGVDGLIDAEHRGHTVASFTLTPPEVAGLLERGAPAPARRIAAMGRLHRAGYPVRIRMSPIVPIRDWRNAYADLIAAAAAAATPDMVTLWTLSMVEAAGLDDIVPLEHLDPGAVAAAERAAAAMRGRKGAPFPPAYRIAVYREIAGMARAVWPGAELSLCLETPEVWDALGDLLVPRCGGAGFRCNCGPRSRPLSPG